MRELDVRWQGVGVAILGPFPPRPGGVSVQCATLAHHLEAAGAHVTRINTDIPAWRHGRRAQRMLFPAAQLVHLTQALARTRDAWQVLHVHAASWWGFMPAVVGLEARRWGKRLVLTYHGGGAAAFMARHGWWARPILHRYDALLTLTPTQARIFRQHGLQPQIVPNIVPTSHFIYRERGPLRPHILWLRHLEPRYRPLDALAVFQRVRQSIPDATFTLVGGGSLKSEVERAIEASRVSGIRLTGPLAAHAIPAAYHAADIFLNTSEVDNLPLTLIEASASGLPIVSTDAGSIPDLIHHGQDGLLAPVGDVDALAHHILTLLSDADLARQLSRAARANAARFDWTHIQPLLAHAYGLTLAHDDHP